MAPSWPGRGPTISPGPCGPAGVGTEEEPREGGSAAADKTRSEVCPRSGPSLQLDSQSGVWARAGAQRTSQQIIIIINKSNSNSSSVSYAPGSVLCVLLLTLCVGGGEEI